MTSNRTNKRASNAKQPYAITVLFEVKSEAYGRFLNLVKENAETSVRDEPDCIRFDVLTPQLNYGASHIFLYEIYLSRAAFEFHLASDHFKFFDTATRDFVLTKTVTEYVVTENFKS